MLLFSLVSMAQADSDILPEVIITRAVLTGQGGLHPVMSVLADMPEPYNYAIVSGAFTQVKTTPYEDPTWPKVEFSSFEAKMTVHRLITTARLEAESLTIRLHEESRFPAPDVDAGNHYVLFGSLMSSGGEPFDRNTDKNMGLSVGLYRIERPEEPMDEAPTAAYWMAVHDDTAVDEAFLLPPWSYYLQIIEELTDSVWLTPMPVYRAEPQITLSPESRKPLGEDECLVSTAFAQSNKLEIGDAFDVALRETTKLSSIYSTAGDNIAMASMTSFRHAEGDAECKATRDKASNSDHCGIYIALEGMPAGETG